MITVEHITKKFVRNKNKKEQEKFSANDDITFGVHDGEIIGILDPNGARERARGILETLLTLPIKSKDIIIGKFLG